WSRKLIDPRHARRAGDARPLRTRRQEGPRRFLDMVLARGVVLHRLEEGWPRRQRTDRHVVDRRLLLVLVGIVRLVSELVGLVLLVAMQRDGRRRCRIAIGVRRALLLR